MTKMPKELGFIMIHNKPKHDHKLTQPSQLTLAQLFQNSSEVTVSQIIRFRSRHAVFYIQTLRSQQTAVIYSHGPD